MEAQGVLDSWVIGYHAGTGLGGLNLWQRIANRSGTP